MNFIREVLFQIHSESGLPGSISEMIYSGSDSGSESESVSESGKKFRIRPDLDPTRDPDPQHCYKLLKLAAPFTPTPPPPKMRRIKKAFPTHASSVLQLSLKAVDIVNIFKAAS